MKPARTFEIYADIAGKYRWRVRARNGQITATSGESFASHRNAKRAAEREHYALFETYCYSSPDETVKDVPDAQSINSN